MKKFLFLLFFTLGVSFSVSAQTKFVINMEARETSVEVSPRLNYNQALSGLRQAAYQGENPRFVPIHIYVWQNDHYVFAGTFQFAIYPSDTMNDIIDRLFKVFF